MLVDIYVFAYIAVICDCPPVQLHCGDAGVTRRMWLCRVAGRRRQGWTNPAAAAYTVIIAVV